MSHNMERRHLTAGQKACVGEELRVAIEAEIKLELIRIHMSGGSEPPKKPSIRSAEKIAKKLKVSDKSLKLVRKLKKEEPEIFEKVKSGGYTLNDAKRNMRVKEHAKKAEKAKSNPQKNTFNGPFELVVADPCWRYDFSKDDADKVENHYETCTVEEIIKHKPNTTEDSILFLWATAPKLLEALEVMKAWGFTYKSHAIWDKKWIGMGYWFRGTHELLLVGTKGNPGCPPDSERVSSIFSEKRTEHSKKPQCVYEWIEKAFPSQTKLEMYCRTPRKNWSSWGNEI